MIDRDRSCWIGYSPCTVFFCCTATEEGRIKNNASDRNHLRPTEPRAGKVLPLLLRTMTNLSSKRSDMTGPQCVSVLADYFH